VRGSPQKLGQPPVKEATLFRQGLLIERKEFFLTLKENLRGRFIRVVEQIGNLFASIIIPASGLKEIQALVEQMANATQCISSKGRRISTNLNKKG
jgi:hypothetical protein